MVKGFATSLYGLSCTNEAYGTQLGGIYTQDGLDAQGSTQSADIYGIASILV